MLKGKSPAFSSISTLSKALVSDSGASVSAHKICPQEQRVQLLPEAAGCSQRASASGTLWLCSALLRKAELEGLRPSGASFPTAAGAPCVHLQAGRMWLCPELLTDGTAQGLCISGGLACSPNRAEPAELLLLVEAALKMPHLAVHEQAPRNPLRVSCTRARRLPSVMRQRPPSPRYFATTSCTDALFLRMTGELRRNSQMSFRGTSTPALTGISGFLRSNFLPPRSYLQ